MSSFSRENKWKMRIESLRSSSFSSEGSSFSESLNATHYDNLHSSPIKASPPIPLRTHQSRGSTDSDQSPSIKWSFPTEISYYPVILGKNYAFKEIYQGELNNYNFLSACAIAIQEPGILEKVIPEYGELEETSYYGQGTLCFRFWKSGSWEDLYIDDTLPTKDGRLVFARSLDPNELWISYLEKAYAKFLGSYEAIEGVSAEDSLRHLTGGVVEFHSVTRARADHVFNTIYDATRSLNSFVACTTFPDKKYSKKWGVIADQGYVAVDAKIILVRGAAEKLIQLRYPTTLRTSRKEEKSNKWSNCTDSYNENDYYWISLREFTQKFTQVLICTRKSAGNPVNTKGFDPVMLVHHGVWKGQSCGGSHWDSFGYSRNPQYLLTVTKPDDPDPYGKLVDAKPGHCSVLISLLQKATDRSPKQTEFQISFSIFEMKDYSKRLGSESFQDVKAVLESGAHKRSREVSVRASLRPGNYVIIPSTFRKFQEGPFLLRAVSRQPILMKFLPQAPVKPLPAVSSARTRAPPVSALKLSPIHHSTPDIRLPRYRDVRSLDFRAKA